MPGIIPKKYGKKSKKNTNFSSEERTISLPSLNAHMRKIDYNKQLDPFIKKLSTNDLIKLREKNLATLKKKKITG